MPKIKNDATMQEVFDFVATHLYKQNKTSSESFYEQGEHVRSMCKYSHNGLSCAVGCLFTEEELRFCVEGRSALYNANKFLELNINKEFWGNWDITQMLEDLQEAHDTCVTDPSGEFDRFSLKHKLSSVAYKYNLEFKGAMHYVGSGS